MRKAQMQFDDEELQILRDFENGEFESIQNFRDEKQKLENAASGTLQKDKRIFRQGPYKAATHSAL